MSDVKPLGGPEETLIFFREGMFYPIQGVRDVPLEKQARDNAVLNLGTLRVEDIHGNVLWSRPDAR